MGGDTLREHNSIRACIDCDQTVSNGSMVRLRLLEPMQAGGVVIPDNSVVVGTAKIEGQRMSIAVSSLEWDGNIIPVQLVAHDMDGQPGLNIPNSIERDAIKNAAAVGSNLGQSISFTHSAAQQVAMDLARGVMNGGSQYLASKVREVKISLKANYQLLLISKK